MEAIRREKNRVHRPELEIKSGTDAAELETLFQSRVNGKCILLSTIQGQVTVEGDEVCVRAQGTWRKMKVSVEKRAAITEPEKSFGILRK